MISIVVATLFNESIFLDDIELQIKTESITKQSLLNLEIVIVTPNPSSTTPSFSFKVKVVQDTKIGIYSAMNLGVENSSGEFIIFVNDGDNVDLSSLLNLHNLYLSTNFTAVYGTTKLFDDTTGNTIEILASLNPNTITEARMPGSHQAQMVRKSEFIKLNGFAKELNFYLFQLKLKYASDFDFYCRSIKSGAQWHRDENFVAYQSLGGATSQHWLRTTLEILAISLRYSKFKPRNTFFFLRTLVGSALFHVPRQRLRKEKLNNGK